MENISIKKLISVASELTMRSYSRNVLKDIPNKRVLSASKYERRMFISLFWTRLNELTQRVYRGQSPDCTTIDSLEAFFADRQSDRLKVSNQKVFFKISLPNQSYFFAESNGRLMVTATEMGTFPVVMPMATQLEIIQAFDEYLFKYINTVVESTFNACHAKIKGDELLTTAAKAVLADMIGGKNLRVRMRQHKDRIYCEICEAPWWGKATSFRTSMETLREDFKIACNKAKISINTRSDNKELLAETAKNNPVYEVFSGADFIDEIDIVPVLRNGKPSGRALKIDGEIMDAFDIHTKGLENALCDVSYYVSSERLRYLQCPDLLYPLCFASVSEEHPLVLPINGEDVKFTSAILKYSDFAMYIGEDRDQEYVVAVDVRLVSEDGGVILFLASYFTEYLSFGKQPNISNPVFGKYYRRMASAMDELGLEYVPQAEGRNKRCLQASRGATKVFAKGLHSLLAYALGVSNTAEDEDAEVYLGTMLYRFPDHIDGGKLENYTKAHQTWCRKLNSLRSLAPNMTMIETPFIYQDVFKDVNADFLPERVKKFYGF